MPLPGAVQGVAMAALGCALLAGPAGCDDSLGGVLIDPDAVGTDQGTLISIADIRTVAQEMVQSMSTSPALGRLRADHSPLRILVGPFKQRTSIAIFDKEVFVNRLVASLVAADLSGFYTFLRRDSIAREAAETGAPAPTGADFVLTGEVRELLHREREEGGGEREKRTVQYTLFLTAVNDAAIAWTHSHEIVKEQTIGAVYR